MKRGLCNKYTVMQFYGFREPELYPHVWWQDLSGHIFQGSEVPSLGTFSGTLSGKWAKVGKMGENGGK